MQQQASPQDKRKWYALGAEKSVTDGVWRSGLIYCLLRSLYPMMALLVHGETHTGKYAMAATVQKNWIAPGFPASTEQHAINYKYVLVCVEMFSGSEKATDKNTSK